MRSTRPMNYDFDLFVIGAGSGGVRAARVSADLGARVGIAEERYLGGTCVNVGCVPKKLFVYGSHYSEDLEDASSYGWSVESTNFSWPILRDNKTNEIKRLNSIYQNLLEASGVEIFNNTATFVDENTVQVGSSKVTSEKILVATGSWPYVPEFRGREFIISSNEMFYLDSLPKRISIVGGGYIAVEFAGIMNGLGVDTTLIYRGPILLRGFDQGIREFVKNELEKKGIRLLFNCGVQSIEKRSGGHLLQLSNGQSISADQVMYATGRSPNTQRLGFENTNVLLNSEGAVVVNDQYQTRASNIYAVGDVINRAQLTPVAIAEGMAFANANFGTTSRHVDYSLIPTCVFCQPNIGTVGPTEEQARATYSDLHVFETSLKPMKHTLTGSSERSYLKLLVDGETDRVIAVHMVGPEAGEIVQGLAVAISAKATKADFDRTIAIHPTMAEEFVTMRSRTR